MGFVVAVIGRFGVGKSVLCEHFSRKGVETINVHETLLDVVKTMPDHKPWCDCLEQKYDGITEKVPLLNHTSAIESIINQVKEAGKEPAEYVIEIPSFVEMSKILEAEVLDFIIAVDCSLRVQKYYLEKKVLADQAIWCLYDSGFERSYYTQVATDIFLNTVSLSHLDWVSDQMLKAYRMVNACK